MPTTSAVNEEVRGQCAEVGILEWVGQVFAGGELARNKHKDFDVESLR